MFVWCNLFLLFQLFDKISKEKKGKVKVFFCGAPQLGKIIKNTCMKYKFNFSKENFWGLLCKFIKNTFLKKRSENTQTFQWRQDLCSAINREINWTVKKMANLIKIRLVAIYGSGSKDLILIRLNNDWLIILPVLRGEYRIMSIKNGFLRKIICKIISNTFFRITTSHKTLLFLVSLFLLYIWGGTIYCFVCFVSTSIKKIR